MASLRTTEIAQQSKYKDLYEVNGSLLNLKLRPAAGEMSTICS